jgi:hypothetical protein
MPFHANATDSEYAGHTFERRGVFHLCVGIGLEQILIGVSSATRRQFQDSRVVQHVCVPVLPAVPVFCGHALLSAIIVHELDVPPWGQATNTGVPALGPCRCTVESPKQFEFHDDGHVERTPEMRNPIAAERTTSRAKVLHMQEILANRSSNKRLGVRAKRAQSTMS